MAVRVVSHKVNDFEVWKSVFDSNIAITENLELRTALFYRWLMTQIMLRLLAVVR